MCISHKHSDAVSCPDFIHNGEQTMQVTLFFGGWLETTGAFWLGTQIGYHMSLSILL